MNPLYGVSKTQLVSGMALFLIVSWAKPIWCSIIFWTMRSKHNAFPGMAFPKHSWFPVWRYFCFCPGPSQSEVVPYFGSWDPNAVGPLYGVSRTKSPLYGSFLILSWANPIWGNMICWMMGPNNITCSSTPSWNSSLFALSDNQNVLKTYLPILEGF